MATRPLHLQGRPHTVRDGIAQSRFVCHRYQSEDDIPGILGVGRAKTDPLEHLVKCPGVLLGSGRVMLEIGPGELNDWSLAIHAWISFP
jgi:hypothetical protein